jgi:hypothetical protein
MRVKIKLARKISRERVLKMIEWERAHQMKFPFMEDERYDEYRVREDAGQVVRYIQSQRGATGRDAEPDEYF